MNAIMGDSVASPLIWLITIVVTVGVLLVDLLIIGRRPHEPSMKEVSLQLGLYVGLAVIFGLSPVVLRRAARPVAAAPGRSSSPAG